MSTTARCKSERAKLDWLRELAGGRERRCARREDQIAFWLNAYNALVLRTVIDHYPIRAAHAEYPANSIRQIPGAFERLQHRVAGRT